MHTLQDAARENKTMELIIKLANGKFVGHFGLVKEYPDAKVYLNSNGAVRDAELASLTYKQDATVIGNYGLDNEAIEESIKFNN